MPKPISKKKCKSLQRVWVKRSRRSKAYCRKKPSRPRAPALAEPRAPALAEPREHAIVAPRWPFMYGFTSELNFNIECEQVEGAILKFMDDYFRDNFQIIEEEFNVILFRYYRHYRRDFPEPELTLVSIRRENCSIRFIFSSHEKISNGAHRMILDAIDNVNIILPQAQIRALFEIYHYDMNEVGFTSHLPDYTNEANLSNPQYRYQFKVGVVIDDYFCDSPVVNDLKENVRNYIIENRERLIRRMNNGLTAAGKNMIVSTLTFDVEKCSFNFMIENGGPLSAVDFQFLCRGHEWEILTEDEFNQVSDRFAVRLNDPFSAEYNGF